MTEQRTLLVGYDFSDDYTQISYYNEKHYEPESVSISGPEQFLIPTVLGVKESSKEWLIGAAAQEVAAAGEGMLVDHLVKRASSDETVTLYGSEFSCVSLLEKYFRKTLSYLKTIEKEHGIAKLIITVPELNETLSSNIYRALEQLKIEKDRVIVKSHAASAMYYALSQSKDLWMNDVGIFHYDGQKLLYYHIGIHRKTKPCAVTIQREDFSNSFGILTEEEGVQNELSYLFLNLAKRVLARHVISTVYITGTGFEGNWINGTLQELCLGRRVFKGQNLYTKGACYMARELVGEKKLGDYILLSEEMLQTAVWISAYIDAKNQELMLAKVGTPWFEIKESVEFIFEDEPEITIYTKSIFGKEINSYKLALEQLDKRPNRTTRAELSVICKEPGYLEVIIRDLGFGELIPATHCQSSMLIPLSNEMVI